MSGEITKLWELYQNGVAYQAKLGITKSIPECVKFYEGKQWPAATANTKNLPRPVVNIVKMICRSKKAAILSSPVKLVYESERGDNVEKFNRFAEYIQKEIGQDALDRKAIEDGAKKGSYFFHYYWDADARGKDGIRSGGVRCEIIDALSIFFQNPTECDEQKQKWILIASREEVSSVKEKCDKGVDTDLIVPDEYDDNPYSTVEQDGDKLCTVLTRYFRKDGEVYCERATRATVINEPFTIKPDVKAARLELGYDEEDAPNDDMTEEGAPEDTATTQAYLYPIVAASYDAREKCIYGIGEVEGLIPNQKAINFNLAMLLLNAQENAWGKYIVHPAALRGQKITNEPGQALIDYTKTMNGIRKMTEQSMHSLPLDLVNQLTQMTRSVSGATEVMSGEVLRANMSGSAIAALQAQASMPIDDLRNNFREAKRKQGLVLAQFFKLFYKDKRFTYDEELPKLDEKGAPVLDDFGEAITEKTKQFGIFDGEEFAKADFDVVTETTTGTKSSAAGDINILDTLLAKGMISLKTYFKAYPSDAISNKSELLAGIEEDEKAGTDSLKAQLSQSQQQLTQATQLLQQQKDTVDKAVGLIQENSRLKTQLVQLYSEAKGKIDAANAQIKADNARISEVTSDAQAFAEHIARSEGAQPQGAVAPI